MASFLRLLDATIDPMWDVHLLMDNGSSHTARKTRAWLTAHPRFHAHWTPRHASWLNQNRVVLLHHDPEGPAAGIVHLM
jgi:DDE superfamily endonuclease